MLENGSMAGAFFETFVVSEIIKSYYNNGVLDLPLYYYRDKDQTEIDLLIEQNGTLFPIEIKKHADVKKVMSPRFPCLTGYPIRYMEQAALCVCTTTCCRWIIKTWLYRLSICKALVRCHTHSKC